MEIVKIIGVGLIALIIIIILKQYKPEFVIYVSLLAGAIILLLSLDKISGIISLLNNLSTKANVNNQFLTILLKITGIAFLTEFAVSICKDSGETAVANKVDLGGKVLIISMSIPIIASLLETILKILPWLPRKQHIKTLGKEIKYIYNKKEEDKLLNRVTKRNKWKKI